jgi:hypothetical protein
MTHTIHRVTRVDIIGPYMLALEFEDGSRQDIDFRPVLHGELLGPLQNLAMFNAVELDAAFGTIQWPNGADFDPETLHDWPKYREEFTAMTQRWAETTESSTPGRANRRMEPTRR